MKKLYAALLLLFIAALPWPSAMAAVAGKVVGAFGYVSALRAAVDGGAIQARKLSAGSVIYNNDTVITGSRARVQIRFVDGTLFHLKKDSELRIDAYRHDPDNAGNNTSFFSLLKGGFRTITGLISRLHKNGYRVRTSIATIGIRGTDYSLQLCASNCTAANGLYAHVHSGGINIENEAGTFALDSGHSAFIANIKQGPEYLPSIPEPITGNRLPSQTRTGSGKPGAAGVVRTPESEILDDLIFSTGDAVRCQLQ